MQTYYNDIDKFSIFYNKYLPLLAKVGITQFSFPQLKIYLDKPYPNMTQEAPNVLYRGDNDIQMYIPFLEDRAKEFGWPEDDYERYVKTQPTLSAMAHEFGHVIHFLYFGPNDSDIWDKIWSLMRRVDKPDFERAAGGGIGGGQVRAYEVFANYFEDIVLGKITNVELLQYIWKLMGVCIIVFKPGEHEYVRNGIAKHLVRPIHLVEGTTYLPIRLIIDELRDVTLKDIIYVEQSNCCYWA